jgi:hypothetical protein
MNPGRTVFRIKNEFSLYKKQTIGQINHLNYIFIFLYFLTYILQILDSEIKVSEKY